ncbi:MAG: Rossmann-like and DUF2520 domain-containing protein [Ginsengibacter sp.]
MKIAIIGAGNVATVLGKLIHKAGHEIVQVLSRNENHAKALAEIFGCPSGSFRTTPYQKADIYLLAISDNSLYHLDQYPGLGNKLAIHTAGSVIQDELKKISENYGILYPLQSLNKEAQKIPEIPFLINGNNQATIEIIRQFALTLSQQVKVAQDSERLSYHVAAVIVNNFTNHLFAMAEDYCIRENIDFKYLFPLVDETMNRMKENSPGTLQTGPAIREDIYTLGKHLQVLSTHPDLKYLYLKLSESILKFHQKKS